MPDSNELYNAKDSIDKLLHNPRPKTEDDFVFAENGASIMPAGDPTSLDPIALALRLAHATNAYRIENGKIALLWS